MSIAVALPYQSLSGAEPTEDAKPIDTERTAQMDGKVDVDLAKLEAQARVVYVSSGAFTLTGRMIDNDVRTVFRFSGSDLHPTVIVELVQSEPLHRARAVFNAEGNTKLDIYLLNELPKKPGELTDATPLACVVDRANLPTAAAAAEFAPNTARYVAFRWTREKSSRAPFAVAEIGAFSIQSAAQVLSIIAEAELHFPGESGSDFSNKLGTMADPPSIAVVSP
jgi:hypothetical protein